MAVVLLSGPVGAFTVTVTTASEEGVGSLRQAITEANTLPGDDTIVFDIPGPGPHFVMLTSALPDLASNLSILNDRPGDETVTVRRENVWPDYYFNQVRMLTVKSGATVAIAGLSIRGGYFDGSGAGILNSGTLSLRNCTITDNFSLNNGGGIYNGGTLTVTNSRIVDNEALGDFAGGGICNASTVTLIRTVIANNTGDYSGGGLSNWGTATLTDCTVDDNSSGNFGGGVHNSSTLNGTNSTFSNNSASSGGGIQNYGAATLKNCTFTGNTAGSGGGLYNFGNARLTNCTFSANSATVGGAVHSDYYALEVGNSIFRRGAEGGNLGTSRGGSFTSKGHNLSDDPAGGESGTGPAGFLTAPGDIRNTDPQLEPLANNGGATQTHALRSGSPAIDAADDSMAPARDQRGYFRKGRSDIGAFEFGGLPLRILSITRQANGRVLMQGDGVINGVHTIQASPDLGSDSFQAIGTAPADDAGLWQFEDAEAAGLPKRFYRASPP